MSDPAPLSRPAPPPGGEGSAGAGAPAPSDAPRPFVITSRTVFRIAAPMTLAYATVPLLGIVDTGVVGRLGDPLALAGLAAGAVAFDLVYGALNFIRAGTTGLVAQAFGRGDRAGEEAVFWRGAALGLAVGLLVALLGPLIAWTGTRGVGVEGEVASALTVYVTVRALGAPFSLVNYAILGYVLGRGEAGLALGLTTLLNGTNIALSVALGLGLGWGVAGVAWATVAGEALATLAGLLILWRRFARASERPGRARLLDPRAARRFFSLNGDIFVRSLCLLGAFALFARFGAGEGPLTLASNAILMNLFLLSAYVLDGLATAAEQLAGRAIGARWPPAFDRAVSLSLRWSFALTAAMFALFVAFGPLLIDAMTTAPELRERAREFLLYAALTGPVGALAFVMDGVFIGATWSRDMRDTMIASLALFVALALGLREVLGNHGLWLALLAFLLARGALLWGRLARRRRAGLPG